MKLMLQEQQEKKRQLMMRHEKSMLHDVDKDGSTQFNFGGSLSNPSNGSV